MDEWDVGTRIQHRRGLCGWLFMGVIHDVHTAQVVECGSTAGSPPPPGGE
jgi:hypothetical protein